MSEVGTPPPHNSEKPHGLVDSINNNIISPNSTTLVVSILLPREPAWTLIPMYPQKT